MVVKKWSEKKGIVKVVEKGGDEVVKVPLGKFTEFFRPGYCITTHAAQGATFDEEHSIYDWKRLCNRGKYVALSRGTKMENVNVVGVGSHTEVFGIHGNRLVPRLVRIHSTVGPGWPPKNAAPGLV